MIGNVLKSSFLYAAFVVPTSSLEGWKQLSFNKIPKNTVTSSNKKLQIKVDSSASPLVYKLPEIVQTKSIEFTYNVIKSNSTLNTNKDTDTEHSVFPEDFVLRVGLVAKGDKSLGWFQRQIAANWVLELFSLAPKNVGLDKIYFYNIATASKLVGQSRIHPKSDLMREEIVASFPENKKINYVLQKSIDVVAIWLSVDGDDTKSSFVTEIEALKLNP